MGWDILLDKEIKYYYDTNNVRKVKGEVSVWFWKVICRMLRTRWNVSLWIWKESDWLLFCEPRNSQIVGLFFKLEASQKIHNGWFGAFIEIFILLTHTVVASAGLVIVDGACKRVIAQKPIEGVSHFSRVCFISCYLKNRFESRNKYRDFFRLLVMGRLFKAFFEPIFLSYGHTNISFETVCDKKVDRFPCHR